MATDELLLKSILDRIENLERKIDSIAPSPSYIAGVSTGVVSLIGILVYALDILKNKW